MIVGRSMAPSTTPRLMVGMSRLKLKLFAVIKTVTNYLYLGISLYPTVGYEV